MLVAPTRGRACRGVHQSGPSGLNVSRIVLGCMSFGEPTDRGHLWSWMRPPSRSSGRRSNRHHLLGHREHLQHGTSEEFVGRAIKRVRPPRGDRPGDEGLRPMHDGPGGRPVAHGDHGAGRRLAHAPGYRLHRPVPDPPVRSRDAGRGDDGGAPRRGQGRQGPLPGRLVDVRLAVREDAARRRPARLDDASSRCRTSTT